MEVCSWWFAVSGWCHLGVSKFSTFVWCVSVVAPNGERDAAPMFGRALADLVSARVVPVAMPLEAVAREECRTTFAWLCTLPSEWEDAELSSVLLYLLSDKRLHRAWLL